MNGYDVIFDFIYTLLITHNVPLVMSTNKFHMSQAIDYRHIAICLSMFGIVLADIWHRFSATNFLMQTAFYKD